MTTSLWAIGLVIIGTIIGSGGPIFFKLGSKKFTMNPIRIINNPLVLIKNWQVIIGCLLYTISAFFLIAALRGGDLSILYPFMSLSYVWASFWSVKFLGEQMNIHKWIGITIIIFSVSFLGISNVLV